MTGIEVFPNRPLALSLGDEATFDEMTSIIRFMPNWKVAVVDSAGRRAGVIYIS